MSCIPTSPSFYLSRPKRTTKRAIERPPNASWKGSRPRIRNWKWSPPSWLCWESPPRAPAAGPKRGASSIKWNKSIVRITWSLLWCSAFAWRLTTARLSTAGSKEPATTGRPFSSTPLWLLISTTTTRGQSLFRAPLIQLPRYFTTIDTRRLDALSGSLGFRKR